MSYRLKPYVQRQRAGQKSLCVSAEAAAVKDHTLRTSRFWTGDTVGLTKAHAGSTGRQARELKRFSCPKCLRLGSKSAYGAISPNPYGKGTDRWCADCRNGKTVT